MEITADLITECTKETNNVAIFIDFDNIFYSLKDYGLNVEDEDYCVFTLMNKIYSFDRIRTMRAYADYDQIKVSFKRLQEKRVQIKNVYGNGREEDHRKNASDIELSIDALDAYYRNPNIDTFVFITSDSDMIPIMSRLIFKGKKVHLYYIEDKVSHYQDLTGFCHIKHNLKNIFKLDSDRLEPAYWESQAITLIEKWYSEPKNKDKNKTLGGKWLNDLLTENLSILPTKATTIIDYLESEGKILRKTQENGAKYFELPPKEDKE